MYRFRACIISNNELGAKARRRGAVDIASAPETEDLSSKPAKGKKFFREKKAVLFSILDLICIVCVLKMKKMHCPQIKKCVGTLRTVVNNELRTYLLI
jgi:hypothetical protein